MMIRINGMRSTRVRNMLALVVSLAVQSAFAETPGKVEAPTTAPDVAVDADGVHLTTTSLPTRIARQVLGPGRLIGVSTHTLAEAQAAAAEGAAGVPVRAPRSLKRPL